MGFKKFRENLFFSQKHDCLPLTRRFQRLSENAPGETLYFIYLI